MLCELKFNPYFWLIPICWQKVDELAISFENTAPCFLTFCNINQSIYSFLELCAHYIASSYTYSYTCVFIDNKSTYVCINVCCNDVIILDQWQWYAFCNNQFHDATNHESYHSSMCITFVVLTSIIFIL